MMDGAPNGTIVIPAHNESAVIGRCLDALEPILAAGGIDVIVACNGCSDGTAEVARARAGVRVIEVEIASKTEALRAADRVAAAGPRVYLDADVVLNPHAAIALFEHLRGEGALAARPPVTFDTRGAQWPVRRWYSVRSRLPSIQGFLWGAGIYALSVVGRGRFDEFPDVVADDLYINGLFSPDEISIVPTDPVIVHTPRTTGDLIRILKRKYRTQHEAAVDGRRRLVSSGQRGQFRDVAALVRAHPALAADSVIYVALIMTARIRARLGSNSSWERDNSSRIEVESSA